MQLRLLPTTVALLLLLSTLSLSGGCAFFKPTPAGLSAEQAKAIDHWNKAMALRAAGEEDRVAVELTATLQSDPDMYQAYYHLGLAYQVLGEDDKARQVWTQGISRARNGVERQDYPRTKALAEMQAALAGLDAGSGPMDQPLTELRPPAPAPAPAPPPQAKRPSSTGGFAVLYSSNIYVSNAKRDYNTLTRKGFKVEIKQHQVRGRSFHRVWVGCCRSRQGAQRMLKDLRIKASRSGMIVMRVGS